MLNPCEGRLQIVFAKPLEPCLSSLFASHAPNSLVDNRTNLTAMHLILTGATGHCGSAVLDTMLKMKDVTKISIISRRPVKMAEDRKDARVNVIIHEDFEKYDSGLLGKLRDATGCVWALGISQTQVGKE